ncbi:MAG: c-type cytochrome [Bacteroidetes bacterium]|nr:c-type cytochrome [Bacteroidota bacterium]
MKSIKKVFYVALMSFIVVSCGSNSQKTTDSTSNQDEKEVSNDPPSYDPKRGTGKFTKVEVGEKLDEKMATEGKKSYDVKCSSCHKLTDEKLVGPGWKGVSQKRTPEWIMNFITNTDEMLNKDPEAQAQLEICLVRMPNQNLGDDEARHLLEFMRQNDGVK